MPDFKEAFEVFADHLRNDEGLYIAYKSNIAMAFYDTCQQNGYSFPQLHELSNAAAEYFLTSLLRKKDEDSDFQTLK